ncbi:MAG TPA: hypothetical protein VFQ35_13845, partial [Polyangiaceae bacterium]|nr:hypothetical protein [Polyangiaceae bacterium]
MAAGAAFAKYLRRYAEAEARQVPRLALPHHAALVVPAFAESEVMLDGYRDAARAAPGPVVVILVVNAPASASDEERAANAALLRSLRARASYDDGQFVFVAEPEFSLLVVDRASPGREIEKKLGVGHARKIGADVALALFARGELESRFVFSTDADACLPLDYFVRPRADEVAGALLFPFEHVEGSDPRVFEMTLLYELSLRYHVLGLAFAGSPYAHHSVGSALAASYEGYAAVRGFPKRAAGEDFYLLDKVGKVLPIRRLAGAPVRILARRSLRVPFGTGPRVERLLSEPSAFVDHPATYQALAALLAALDAFAQSRDDGSFARAFTDLPRDLATAADAAARELGILEAARGAIA